MKKLLLALVFSFYAIESKLPYNQNSKLFYSSVLASGIASGLSAGTLLFKFSKEPILRQKLLTSALTGFVVGGFVSWAFYLYLGKKYIPKIIRDIKFTLASIDDDKALLRYYEDRDFDKFLYAVDGHFAMSIDSRVAAYDHYKDLYYKIEAQSKAAESLISDNAFKDLSHEYKQVLIDCLPLFDLYKNILSVVISKIKQTPYFDIMEACVRQIDQSSKYPLGKKFLL